MRARCAYCTTFLFQTIAVGFLLFIASFQLGFLWYFMHYFRADIVLPWCKYSYANCPENVPHLQNNGSSCLRVFIGGWLLMLSIPTIMRILAVIFKWVLIGTCGVAGGVFVTIRSLKSVHAISVGAFRMCSPFVSLS